MESANLTPSLWLSHTKHVDGTVIAPPPILEYVESNPNYPN